MTPFGLVGWDAFCIEWYSNWIAAWINSILNIPSLLKSEKKDPMYNKTPEQMNDLFNFRFVRHDRLDELNGFFRRSNVTDKIADSGTLRFREFLIWEDQLFIENLFHDS